MECASALALCPRTPALFSSRNETRCQPIAGGSLGPFTFERTYPNSHTRAGSSEIACDALDPPFAVELFMRVGTEPAQREGCKTKVKPFSIAGCSNQRAE